jgi:hypothetical protein
MISCGSAPQYRQEPVYRQLKGLIHKYMASGSGKALNKKIKF